METPPQKVSIAMSSAVAFALLPASVIWMTRSDRYTKIAIIVAFFDFIPFVLALVWVTTNYRRSPTSFTRNVISILAVVAFIVMPAAFWWASLYEQQDRARTLPIVIAAADTVPFVLGMMWFAFRFPRFPDAFGRWFINHPSVGYLFISLILLGFFLRIFFHN